MHAAQFAHEKKMENWTSKFWADRNKEIEEKNREIHSEEHAWETTAREYENNKRREN